MPREYLTTQMAADYLGLAKKTLEGMRLSGSGPKFFKVGPGRRAPVRYTYDDIDAWVGAGHAASTSEYDVRQHNRQA